MPSVKPPLEDFLEFVPKLTPRFYTISSSSRVRGATAVLKHSAVLCLILCGVLLAYAL